MEKKKYYISLHTSAATAEIRDEKGNATFDFEIEATDEEVHYLDKMIRLASGSDDMTYIRPHIQPFSDQVDHDHAKYDTALNKVYQRIYELGTPETKQQMESMGILDALKGTTGDHEDFTFEQ